MIKQQQMNDKMLFMQQQQQQKVTQHAVPSQTGLRHGSAAQSQSMLYF
jgi:hypothetical protein